jgi:hypothetical protein
MFGGRAAAMGARDVLLGRGHPNIRALHPTTLAFTTDEEVTTRGDCFVAVGMERALPALDPGLRAALRAGAVLTVTIEAGGLSDTVRAVGCEALTLGDPTDMVVRRSGWVCPRTLAVAANKAARDLDRGLVARLREGGPVRVTLECADAQD